jgi:hypothetical protein
MFGAMVVCSSVMMVQSGSEQVVSSQVANVYGGDQVVKKKEIRARRLKCVDKFDVPRQKKNGRES